MKKNKFLSALSAAVMAFSALALPTAYADQLQSAEEILSDGAFQYENVDGGYKITKCTASIITEIPSVRNGIAIVEIGKNAFAGFTGVTDLVIPDSVKVIGENAFYGCTNVKTLTLPKNLASMDDGAFASCTALESLTLPSTLKTIDTNAFRGCSSLETLEIPESVTNIGSGAFSDCTGIKELTLLNSSSDIHYTGTFSYCTSLENMGIKLKTPLETGRKILYYI